MNYYLICFLLSGLLTTLYIYKWQNRYGIQFCVMYIFGSVANFGYWQIYEATELSTAILANKMAYFGGCYTILAMMVCIFDVCKIQLNKYVRGMLYVLTGGVFLSSLTVGNSRIFYKDVSLDFVGGRYVMVKEYAFFHTVFYIMLVAYIIMGLAALFVGLRKKHDVSIKSIRMMFFVMLANLLSFFVGRALFDVELITASYVLSEIVMLIITNRLVLYNIDDLVATSLMSKGDMGAAAFDFDGSFLGSNDIARSYYPPLSLLHIDKKINARDNSLKELILWLDTMKEEGAFETIYSMGDNYYKVTAKYLYDEKETKRGYHLIFTDHTEEKRHEEELIRISITDELTGIRNRRAYEDDAALVDDSDYTLVIASFDLNGLKKANDSLGHAAGDELIRAAANCLQSALAAIGNVYRTGGDEFAGIFHCTKEELDRCMADLDQKVLSWRGVFIDSMTISRGIASRAEFPGYSVPALEKEADDRMYLDKKLYYERTGIDRRRQ